MNAQQPLDALAIGRVVTEIQLPPKRILETAKELGIEPAMILNGVIHFHRRDIDKIASKVYPGPRVDQ